MLACSGLIVDKPVSNKEGKLEVKPMMKIIFTFDHRYGDGSVLRHFLKLVRIGLEDRVNFDISKYEELPPYGSEKKVKK